MLDRLKRLLFLKQGKGFRAREYAMAAVANPRLLGAAMQRVLTGKSRSVESAVRASHNKGLRGPVPKNPQPIDDLINGLAQNMGVLVLDRTPSTLWLGVADIDLISALVYLTSATPGCEMSIDQEPVSFGSPLFKSRAMAANYIIVTFNGPNLEPFSVKLEGYARQGARKWVSPNTGNTDLRGLYSDFLETPGVYLADDILAGPTLRSLSAKQPVDVVYTWVNHNDPDWQKMYQGQRADDGLSVDSNALSRFHNNDELRYSLRSVERNMPWVRKIFVFTNCARPAWVSEASDRLVWVDHRDVIPAEYLPTFNSHVIESFLHHIPDLSERFVYFNDDFFIMMPLSPGDFFTESGQSRSRLEGYGMVSGEVRAGDPDYLNASRNSSAFLKHAFGFVSTQLHLHVPYALRRSTMTDIETLLGDRVAAFRGNKFRKLNDINIPSFFYHHYALHKGMAVLTASNSIMVKSNDIRWRVRLEMARTNPYSFVCINEGGAQNPTSDWHENIEDFMKEVFRFKASWER